MLSHLVLFLSSCGGSGKGPQIPIWSPRVDLRATQPAHRVFITPEGHDLVILTHRPDPGDGSFVPLKWPLHNDILPVVRIRVSPSRDSRDGRFVYEYSVSNGAAAHQNIVFINLIGPAFDPGGTEAGYHAKTGEFAWPGGVASVPEGRQVELDDSVGQTIYWTVPERSEGTGGSRIPYRPIQPGEARNGFVVHSSAMPGFTTIGVTDEALEPPEDATAMDLSKEEDDLRIAEHFRATTLTLGPMFAPEAVPREVLANYRLGVDRLRHCSGIPHSAAFLDEVSQLLSEPGIESQLATRLASIKTRPRAPIEIELIDCLRLVARAFAGTLR